MFSRRISFNVFVYLIIFLFGAFSFALKFQTLSLAQDSFEFFATLDILRSESSPFLFLLFFCAAFLSQSNSNLFLRRAFVLILLVLVLFSAYSLSIFQFLSSESVTISKALFWINENKGIQFDRKIFGSILIYLCLVVLITSASMCFFICMKNGVSRKSFIVKIVLSVLFLGIGFVPPLQNVLPYSISYNSFLYFFKSASQNVEKTLPDDENARYEEWQVQIKQLQPEKNLVFIILDTMRGDVLSIDPPDLDQHPMPYLQSLASQSLVFEQTYGSVPNTSKSLIAMFCGILPHLDFNFPEANQGIAVNCLPEIMSKYFYKSVFFQGESSTLNSRGDLLKQMGFEEVFTGEALRPNKQFESNSGRYDDEYILDFSKGWLSWHYNKRFVMGFLLSNNAYPYRIPEKSAFTAFTKQKNLNAHLNALSYSDSVIENLLEEFKQKQIYRNTVFIFVSAHGEAFGEHGKQQHHNVAYNEVSRVLFMIHDGKRVIETGNNQVTVSQLQILPTALELLGLEAGGRGLPESVFQGGGRAIGACYEPATCQFYVDSQFKYIDNFNEKPAELFNIKTDPNEKNNLILEKPELAESMRQVLENHVLFHQSALYNFYSDKNAEAAQ